MVPGGEVKTAKARSPLVSQLKQGMDESQRFEEHSRRGVESGTRRSGM